MQNIDGNVEVKYSDTSQHSLHVCAMDWINEVFNSKDNESLESIKKIKSERFTGDEFEGLENI